MVRCRWTTFQIRDSTMNASLTKSISPFIYPIYPKNAGILYYNIDIGKFFHFDHARDYTGYLSLESKLWKSGKLEANEVRRVKVEKGIPEETILLGEQTGFDDGMAYLEMQIGAEFPMFDRPMFENPMAVLLREEFGGVLITDSPKFSDTRIIEQIREIGSYCMAHTGVSIDLEKGYGDNFLLINPYERPLVVRLKSNHGEQLRVKVESHDVVNVDLRPLMGNDKFAAVSLTAKQRIILYDVKAPLDNPLLPNSIDHLDPFRGEYAYNNASLANWAKFQTRSLLRRVGISKI